MKDLQIHQERVEAAPTSEIHLREAQQTHGRLHGQLRAGRLIGEVRRC